MHFTLGVKTDETVYYKFPIAIDDLVSVIRDSYLGLGTSYDPIVVDDFVTLTRSKYPEIAEQTTISIQLVYESGNPAYADLKPQIVCCKIRNIGRAFNNDSLLPENHWSTIFQFDENRLLSAPDGILYVSPDKDNICHITTKKEMNAIYLAYSVIIAMTIPDNTGEKRRYYFILDPVVRIRSNSPKP